MRLRARATQRARVTNRRITQVPSRDLAMDEYVDLVELVDGCKNDARGRKAKQSIIMSHIKSTPDADLLDVLLALQQHRCINLRTEPLMSVLTWKESKSSGDVSDATHPGFYLASTLSTCAVSDMPEVMNKFLEATPRVDVISVLRFIRKAGFIGADDEALVSDDIIDWNKPSNDGKVSPEWHNVWSGVSGRGLPLPGPMVDAHTTGAASTQLNEIREMDEPTAAMSGARSEIARRAGETWRYTVYSIHAVCAPILAQAHPVRLHRALRSCIIRLRM